jgi:hypothetical protein
VQEGTQEETTAVVPVVKKKGNLTSLNRMSQKGVRRKFPYTPYDFDFLKIAERLKAVGLSDDDLVYVFGVGNIAHIKKWKIDSPEFKEACRAGKEIATRNLLATGFRAAKGFDYEETTEKWERDTNIIDRVKLRLKERMVYKRHQPPDTSMLQNLLGLIDKRWSQPKGTNVEIARQQNINIGSIRFDGTLDSKRIERLANRLLPKDTEDNERKLVVSTEVGR